MSSPVWHLDASLARLDFPELAAEVQSAQPARGLGSLTVYGANWSGARLLGLSSQAIGSSAAGLAEWFVRGNDLVAVFESGPPHSARIDLCWRAVAGGESDAWFARIDLMVSVRTDRLDWRHDIAIESDLSDACFQFTEHQGCAIFRGDRWTYTEFVHPADLRHDEPTDASQQAAGHLRRRLFPPESLEKGVILRARARSLFLPPDVAASTIACCYDNFIAADPPLVI
jgi:hypothetical protein